MKTDIREFIGKSGLGLTGIFLSNKLTNGNSLRETDKEEVDLYI